MLINLNLNLNLTITLILIPNLTLTLAKLRTHFANCADSQIAQYYYSYRQSLRVLHVNVDRTLYQLSSVQFIRRHSANLTFSLEPILFNWTSTDDVRKSNCSVKQLQWNNKGEILTLCDVSISPLTTNESYSKHHRKVPVCLAIRPEQTSY